MKNLRQRIVWILILASAFGFVTFLMLEDGLEGVGVLLYERLAPFTNNPTRTWVALVLLRAGSFVSVSVVIAVLFLLPFTRIQFGIPLAINAILTLGLSLIVKSAVSHTRPDVLGFPNALSTFNAAFYAMLVLVVFQETKRRRVRLAVLLPSLAIPFVVGLSQTYLDAHAAGDVLAGWLLGACLALCVNSVWMLLLSERA